MDKMIKPVLVSYGASHANIASLVYEALIKRGGCSPAVIALTVAGEIFEKNNIPYTSLFQYLDLFEDKEDIVQYGEALADKYYNSKSSMDYNECVAYLGLGFRDLKNEIGLIKAKEMFQKMGRKAVCAIGAMKTIFEHIKPDVVVLTCEVRMEKAAGLAANELGIPVVRIVDYFTFFPTPYQAITCVMNDWVREYAIKERGILPHRIFVTGQPVLENDLKFDRDEIKRVSKLCKIERFKKVVIYLEQPDIEREIAQVEGFFRRFASSNKDILIVFKLHPNQDKQENQWLDENVILLQDISLKALLHLCDLAITKDSLSGLEAVVLGKTMINIILEPLKPESCDYMQFGISERVENIDDLGKVIVECLDSQSGRYRRQELARQRFNMPLHAADNIAGLIFCAAYGHKCSSI